MFLQRTAGFPSACLVMLKNSVHLNLLTRALYLLSARANLWELSPEISLNQFFLHYFWQADSVGMHNLDGTGWSCVLVAHTCLCTLTYTAHYKNPSWEVLKDRDMWTCGSFKILSEMSKCCISNVLLPIMKKKLKTYYTRFLFSPQCNKKLKSCWHSMWCMWYACVFIWQYCTSFKWQNYSKYKDESCSASCHHNYPDRYIVAIRLYKKLHRLIPEPKLASSGLGNYSTN